MMSCVNVVLRQVKTADFGVIRQASRMAMTVSYTPMTLPTKREVGMAGGGGCIAKKREKEAGDEAGEGEGRNE